MPALTSLRVIPRTFLASLLVLAGCASPDPNVLQPTAHADFTHDTLALTWQPGFCTNGQCRADQPQTPLIGLHGLWASEPQDLVARGVPVQQWWAKGCDFYETPAADMPEVSASVAAGLTQDVAHVRQALPAHEWNKHGRCFGYDPDQFFRIALDLRDRFAHSPLGRMLERSQGQTITQDALQAALIGMVGPVADRAMQLRCGRDEQGRAVLEQLWFTLKPEALPQFPQASAFTTSPEVQGNCPGSFMLQGWGG